MRAKCADDVINMYPKRTVPKHKTLYFEALNTLTELFGSFSDGFMGFLGKNSTNRAQPQNATNRATNRAQMLLIALAINRIARLVKLTNRGIPDI